MQTSTMTSNGLQYDTEAHPNNSNWSVYGNNVSSDNTSKEFQLSPEVANVLYIRVIAAGLLAGFGMIASIVSIMTLQKIKPKTTNTFLLQALAAVDGLVLTCEITLMFLSIFDSPDKAMAAMTFIQDGTQLASNWVLVHVALDRYIYIRYPFAAPTWCTLRAACRIMTVVMLASLGWTLPRFFRFYVFQATYDPEGYMVTDMIVRYYLQIAILFFLNIQLLRALHKAEKEHAHLTGSGSDRHSVSTNVTVNLVAVVISALICGTCRAGFVMCMYALPSMDLTYTLAVMDTISYMLITLNSSINFFIYFFFYNRFRKILISTCTRKPYINESSY